MGLGQGLIGLGILMMLAADLVGFLRLFFYIVFSLGAAAVVAGVLHLYATRPLPSAAAPGAPSEEREER